MKNKFVYFEDIGDIACGGEDEAIARIDAEREESAFQNDVKKGHEALIDAVHTARRFFL